MINQRRSVPARQRARRPDVLWKPKGLRATPRRHDVYLVIDELEDQTVVALASRWPELDTAGRLHFEDTEPITLSVTQQALENTVRRSSGKRGLDRPLRIGDCFLVRRPRGESDDALADALTQNNPEHWGEFIDITRAARDAAKAALYAAAAPRVSEETAKKLGLTKTAPPEEPPPTATSAAPAQNL